jgi:large subunit ribosomal protein L25
VALPANVKLTITDRDFTIATIAAPAGLKAEEEEEGAETAADEVEVIGEETEEAAEEGGEE